MLSERYLVSDWDDESAGGVSLDRRREEEKLNNNLLKMSVVNQQGDSHLLGACQSADKEEEIEIIDLDEEEGSNTETSWLISVPQAQEGRLSDKNYLEWLYSCDNELPSSASTDLQYNTKKTLVAKLDEIQRGSPVRMSPAASSPYRQSNMSPGISSYLARTSISSTPKPTFDSRTFTRRDRRAVLQTLNDFEDTSPLRPSLERKLNTTFDKFPAKLDMTFDLNSTFSKDSSPLSGGSPQLNSTFSKEPGGLNATFDVPKVSPPMSGARKMSEDRLSSASSCSMAERRMSRESSHDRLEDDRLSTTSESSASHRLNDVGDVQQLARMQEESLRQPLVTPNNFRSATMSPSSEHSLHSPMTEDGNGYSPEGSSDHRRNGQQYSSQDSLPDSPYSSQSLDSQPPPQDPLRRSMPNLNKIRGRGGAASHVTNGGRPAYGLSRQHNSDPRLQRKEVPGRGTTYAMRGEHSGGASRYTGPASRSAAPPARPMGPPTSRLRPPTATSKIARPAGTGIPRPGMSRLPAPSRPSMPRSNPGSQPGSRASSVGPRKYSNQQWMEDCY